MTKPCLRPLLLREHATDRVAPEVGGRRRPTGGATPGLQQPLELSAERDGPGLAALSPAQADLTLGREDVAPVQGEALSETQTRVQEDAEEQPIAQVEGGLRRDRRQDRLGGRPVVGPWQRVDPPGPADARCWIRRPVVLSSEVAVERLQG